jgi:hypothetical protein
MGELLDKLNALDDFEPAVEPIEPFDQVMQAFRSASERVNEAIEIVQEPGMSVEASGAGHVRSLSKRWRRRS